MSDALKEHVFEPFFSTKPKEKGTGLGLSTVYGIVKQRNGIIEIRSKENEGTVFEVYLPEIEGLPVHRASRLPFSDKGGSKTIILVEDDNAVRTHTHRILSSAGYKVITARNGGEALLECNRATGIIDMILTDIVMPKMSGVELVERFRRGRTRVRVLYMSGYTDNLIVQHGVLEPGINFIGKPFRSKELLEKVRWVLDSPAPN